MMEPIRTPTEDEMRRYKRGQSPAVAGSDAPTPCASCVRYSSPAFSRWLKSLTLALEQAEAYCEGPPCPGLVEKAGRLVARLR